MPMPGYGFDSSGVPLALGMGEMGAPVMGAQMFSEMGQKGDLDPLTLSFFAHMTQPQDVNEGVLGAQDAQASPFSRNYASFMGPQGQFYTPGSFGANPGLSGYFGPRGQSDSGIMGMMGGM